MKHLAWLLLLAIPLHAQTPFRVVDKKFIALESGQLALGLLDAGMTQACIHQHTCTEGNPWMPSSMAGQFGVVIGSSTAEAYGAYLLRKHTRLWWIPTAIAMGGHGYGAYTGSRYVQWRFVIP